MGPIRSGRTASRAGLASVLWGALTSLRLTTALLLGIIGFSILGTLIAQQATSPVPLEKIYAPDTLYLMKVLGLTNLFHSGWFIFLLALLALNLICLLIDQLPSAWKTAMQKVPPAVNLDTVMNPKAVKRPDRYLYNDIKSPIGREEFRDVVKNLARKRIGKHHVVQDEGGLSELQIAVQEGRFSRLALHGCQASVVIMMIGALIGGMKGFRGQVSVDEGMKVDFVQITDGNDQGWPLLKEQGRVIPRFFQPGFEIENKKIELEFHKDGERIRNFHSWLQFSENGQAVHQAKASFNSPVKFRGIAFHERDQHNTGQWAAAIKVSDRLASTFEDSAFLQRGDSKELPDASIRLMDAQGDAEGMGPAVKLEYVEGKKEPEQFWIFHNYPNYDAVKRKQSRYTFVLESIKPRFSVDYLVSMDPGAKWFWLGAALFLACLLTALFTSHNRYWFIWNPGHVTLVGWTSKPVLGETRFERIGDYFRARISGKKKS